MNKVMYRIHFRSGLSIDVCEETDKDNIIDVWRETLSFVAGNFLEADGINGSKYVYRINDIVAFEKL